MALFNLFGKKADTLPDSKKEQILNRAKELVSKGRYTAAWDTLTGDGKFYVDKIWIDYHSDTVVSLIEECEDEMESIDFIGRYNPKSRWAESVKDLYLFYAKNCYAKGNYKGALSNLTNGDMKSFEKRWQGYRYDEAMTMLRDCEAVMSKEESAPQVTASPEKPKQTAFSAAQSKGSSTPAASGGSTLKDDLFSHTYTPSQLEKIKEAAKNGDKHAVCQYCAYMIKNSNYRSEDYTEWLDMLYKAFKDGYAEASYVIGVLALMAGDDEEGHKALLEAAGRGYNAAVHCCLVLYEEKKLKASERDYYRWLETLAEDDSETKEDRTKYQCACGAGYLEGKGMSKDVKRAIYWYEKAAKNGSIPAMHNLCYIYQKEPYSIDATKAFYWIEKAANAGDADAMVVTGSFYLGGKGTCKDQSKAFYWIQKAAQTGFPLGIYALGVYYAYGIGTDEDMTKAKELFKKAKNSADAEDMEKIRALEKECNFTF